MRRFLILCAVVAGCSPSGKPFHYAMDNVLRYDAVQVKGTHNSYHVETPGNDVSYWHFSQQPLDVQLDREGVRQIELDLHWIKDDDNVHHHFEVFHVPAADEGTTCRQFQDCLRTIKGWSDRYPGHLPIYIQMEAKEGFDPALADDFIANLDSDMLAVFPRCASSRPTSCAAARRACRLRSPRLADAGAAARARAFNFDNRSEMRAAYTRKPDEPRRAAGVRRLRPDRSVRRHLDPERSHRQRGEHRHRPGPAHMLVRTRADSDGVQAQADPVDYTMYDAALASSATFISTDFPVPVAGTTYSVSIPDGTPARCNAVTAPADCTSQALEDPAFVGSGATP